MKRKAIAAILLSAVLLSACSSKPDATTPTTLAETETPAAPAAAELADDYTGKTVILQSNDVHGAIDRYQYMAGLRNELEKRGADVQRVVGAFVRTRLEITAETDPPFRGDVLFCKSETHDVNP